MWFVTFLETYLELFVSILWTINSIIICAFIQLTDSLRHSRPHNMKPSSLCFCFSFACMCAFAYRHPHKRCIILYSGVHVHTNTLYNPLCISQSTFVDHAVRRYTSYSQLTIAHLIFSSVAKQMHHLSDGCCVRSVPPRLFYMHWRHMVSLTINIHAIK